MVIKESFGDRVFSAINITLLFIILFVVLYPIAFILSASISDPQYVNTGQMWLIPKGLTFEGYKLVFLDESIMVGYKNTIIYTVLGTVLNLIFTMTAAYALSKKYLPGRNAFMLYIAFTMYFSGGLIPSYLMIRGFGWINSLWVMIIPGLVGVTNLIISRTFFANSVPQELEEAAMIDGSSVTRIFLTIVLPLSKPVISVMALYYGVSHWNSYFGALIYLHDRNRYPLQLVLREILIQNQMKTQMMASGIVQDEDILNQQLRLASLIRYSVIVVSSLPVIIVYPFLQRYFAKGVMIGAIKG